MSLEEKNAEAIFQKLEQRRIMVDEFEKLRPTWKSDALRIACWSGIIATVMWFIPGILEQPILYILMLLVVGTNFAIHRESERIDNRIDALYRLVKNETDKTL